MGVSSTPVIPQIGPSGVNPGKSSWARNSQRNRRTPGGLQGRSVNLKERILLKLLSYIILAVPRHSEGARIGRIWLIDRFSLARKPLPETRICDSPRLLTSNTKCGNLEEVLWVDVFCVGYFFFLNPSFYNPGQKTKSQM